MPKAPRTTKAQTSPREHESSTRNVMTSPSPEREAKKINLIEISAGLFLNVDQIVSIRVLPEEDDKVYAILQLSNGDKLNLTRVEFTAITSEEPRLPARLAHKSMAK